MPFQDTKDGQTNCCMQCEQYAREIESLKKDLRIKQTACFAWQNQPQAKINTLQTDYDCLMALNNKENKMSVNAITEAQGALSDCRAICEHEHNELVCLQKKMENVLAIYVWGEEVSRNDNRYVDGYADAINDVREILTQQEK